MTPEFVVTTGQEAIKLLVVVTMPLLGVALVVGVLVSIFQTVTQLQEATLTFIPKIIAVFLAFLFFSPWMLSMLLDFTRQIFANIPNYVR